MGYYKPTFGDVKQYLPFLKGLKIYDYNGQTEYLRFDGTNDFNKVASITITGYASNKASVEIKLTDGGVIHTQFLARANSGGASTYTGKIKTSNNTIYFVNDGGTSNSASTTTSAYWYVDFYKFIGNNGVEIQSGQQTFNSTGSSASTPSGNFSTTIKYTVTFDANGGSCVQTVAYATSASTAVTLPTPKRSGYMFEGWYTAANGGTKAGDAGASYTPSANITLYAQWGKPSTVTYDANGGTCDKATEPYNGTALTLPTPTRDGYWFAGWSDGTKTYAAGESYRATGDVTLTAQWSPVYTVTYNANGGSVTPASAKYEGTALTLPTPTGDGAFDGWYTAASGGTRIGGAGESYIPSANITLYAQWKTVYTVTFNADGGTAVAAMSNKTNPTITLPSTSKEGHTFQGWSDGTKTYAAGQSYTPTANITLTAQWTINSYTITVTTSNATVTVNGTKVNNNGTVQVQYGSTVSVSVSYSQSNSQSTTIKNSTTGNNVNLASGTTANGTFTMPASNVTINATSSGSCVTGDTLVTLADGSAKRMDAITEQDLLLVWDHFEGKFVAAPAAIIFNHGYANNTVIALNFSDGTTVKVLNLHQFLDADLQQYVSITAETVEQYVGHNFVKRDGDSYKTVTLDSYTVTEEYAEAYGIISAYHYNILVADMFSTDFMEEDFPLFNYFQIGEDMKFDVAAMQADIEKYGLYTYADFADHMTYEQFVAFNVQYMKVSVGKGVYTYEQILDLIDTYLNT